MDIDGFSSNYLNTFARQCIFFPQRNNHVSIRWRGKIENCRSNISSISLSRGFLDDLGKMLRAIINHKRKGGWQRCWARGWDRRVQIDKRRKKRRDIQSVAWDGSVLLLFFPKLFLSSISVIFFPFSMRLERFYSGYELWPDEATRRNWIEEI